MAHRIRNEITAFSASPTAGRRRPREESRKHLEFIRSLPCCLCKLKLNVEAAHIRIGSADYAKRETGTSEKPDDRWTVPLCARHHQLGPESQHAVGERAFWARHGIDPFRLALLLAFHSGDEEIANGIIARLQPVHVPRAWREVLGFKPFDQVSRDMVEARHDRLKSLSTLSLGALAEIDHARDQALRDLS